MNRGVVTSSLWFIFWGALIAKLDPRIYGWDVLPDLPGLALVLVGVFRLGTQPGGPRFERLMPWVKAGAVVALVIHGLVLLDPPRAVLILVLIGRIFLVIALLLFFLAMIGFAGHWALERSAKSWQTSRMLYFLLFLLPIGLVKVIAFVLFMRLRENPFAGVNEGWLDAIVFLQLVAIVPMIHWLVSLYRTQGELKNMPPPTPPDGGSDYAETASG